MKIKGVLTGDIIRSGRLNETQRNKLLEELKRLIAIISDRLKEKIKFEIIRGDSFQALINNPEMTLKIAILLRAGLRSKTIPQLSIKNAWDTRVAIGIGTVEFEREKINESDGEAFKYSGHLLEYMKNSNDKITIKTPWNEVNDELDVECKLADAIITNWTYNQSEAIFLYWLGDTQTEIAKQLEISQAALQMRINLYGKLDCIEVFNTRFKELIKKCNADN